MRALLIMIVAAFMAACAQAPSSPVQSNATAQVVGFGTLADFGTWEMDLAPAYTRLAVLRHRAVKLLTGQKISVGTAIAVQDAADRARALLDTSRRGNAKQPTPEQRQQLDAARRLIADAEALLEI